MNRPNRLSFEDTFAGDYDYEEALVRYMDELEDKLTSLDKVLDEACNRLEMFHRGLYNLVTDLNDCSAIPRTEPYPMWKTKEEWKKTILEEIENN